MQWNQPRFNIYVAKSVASVYPNGGRRYLIATQSFVNRANLLILDKVFTRGRAEYPGRKPSSKVSVGRQYSDYGILNDSQ